MIISSNLRIIIIGIVAIGFLSAAFHGLGLIKSAPWHIVYSDTLGFYQRISAPGLPYLDKNLEYPVITGFFIQLMAWLGQSRAGYFIFTSLFLIFIAALATYFLYKITLEPNKKRLWQFWIFAPSMLFFSIYNWDLIAVLFTILAFYFAAKDKDGWAAFFLALGFSAKFYPIIYLPILILKNLSWKNVFKLTSVFLFTFFILNSLFIFSNFDGWSYFYTLNQTRNSNPDSIWTIVRFFFRRLDTQSINVISLIFFAASYAFSLWKFKKQGFVWLCFVGTLLFLIFNKVFSPQYILWLLPFFVLLPHVKKWLFYTLEFSNLTVLFLILPWHLIIKDSIYFYLSAPFVIIRHIILVTLIFSAAEIFKLYRAGRR